jgi:hypothetical protein
MSKRGSHRIASGPGLLGRPLQAPVEQVRARAHRLPDARLPGRSHDVHHAEAALARPAQGYARDFVPLMGEILPDCVEREHPRRRQRRRRESDGCARRRCSEARAGGAGRREGRRRHRRRHHGPARRAARARPRAAQHGHGRAARPMCWTRIQSANAYIGARPIVDALNRGAHVVITGRSTDTALTYAPMMHEFGWAPTTGTARRRRRRRPHQRVRRAGERRQLARRVAHIRPRDVGYPIIEA